MFRVVLETDPNVIAGKVAMQSTEASGSLSEQVLTITASFIVFDLGSVFFCGLAEP